jgi:SAM-dependent methyltransferase
MHTTSYNKMESFFRTYAGSFPKGADGRVRVLEIGSKSYEGQGTYRPIIDAAGHAYLGLDLEAGENVDIVPALPFVWPEIADESVEVCISGQTFEHNPFFWVTACEMVRVLRPGGYLCIIAPGSGPVHRYPMDCWRFYPDSWSAVCALAGLELVETYWEGDSLASHLNDWGPWRDTMLIARRPLDESGAFAGAAVRRAQVTQPFRDGFGSFEAVSYRAGPAVADYLASVERQGTKWPLEGVRRKLARRLYTRYEAEIFEPEAAPGGHGHGH